MSEREENKIEVALHLLKTEYEKNKYRFYAFGASSFLFCDYIVGNIIQSGKVFSGQIEQAYKIQNFVYGIYDGWPMVLILHTLSWLIFYKACAMLHSTREHDDERNYDISKENYYGSAIDMNMNEEEKKKTFEAGDYSSILGNIIGADLKNASILYSLKPGYGINDNVFIVGCPGSGKSRCISRNYILQMIRRGESAVISDPKGELYGSIRKLAEAHGYIVKILNVHEKRMLHSDGVDFMGVVGDDELMAQSMSATIIQNLVTDHDFWTDTAMNELTMVILYVNTNEEGIPKTLGGIFNFINTHDIDELDAKFAVLPADHPAKAAYYTWTRSTQTVKDSTHSGLQIYLQKLSVPLVQKITGTPDIDFTLPGKQKCLYFVSFNDQNQNFKFILALFFTFLCQELVNLADYNGGKLDVVVNLLLDEFYSLGIIPDFDIRLSNMRSRGINSIIMVQSLGQLQIMYPDNLWEAILDCCSLWICLQTNSKLTADYFSYRSGEQTVEDKTKRYEERAGDLAKIHANYTVSESHGKRYAFTPHDILTMNPDEMLVVVTTHNALKMKKVDYSLHPMNKEIREIKATEHKPVWVNHLTRKERERFHVADIVYNEHPELNYIELCTEEDFKEPWSPKKQAELDQKLGRLAQKRTKKKAFVLPEGVIEDNYDKQWEVCNSDGSTKRISGYGISEKLKKEAKKAKQLGYEKEVDLKKLIS